MNTPGTHYVIHSTQPLEIVLGELAQANVFEEIFLPPFYATINADWNVALLADGATKASCFVARGHMGQCVCQVVELAPVE